jgi:hypothetical protein
LTDTGRDDKGSAASLDVNAEEMTTKVKSADLNSDDKESVTALDSMANDVASKSMTPTDVKSDSMGLALSLDSNHRFIDEMLSDCSFNEGDIDIVDEGSEVHEECGDEGGDSMFNHLQLLAQYQSPSFASAPVTSMSLLSFDGTRPEFNAATDADDGWTLRSDPQQGSTFTEDLLDRIRIALSGTFTTTSFTGKSSFSSDNQKEMSACEDDSAQSTPMNRDAHEKTTIQISTADDFGDCGFEIFETT